MTKFLMIVGVLAITAIGIIIGFCNILASEDQDKFLEKFLVIEGAIFIVGFSLLGMIGIRQILGVITLW